MSASGNASAGDGSALIADLPARLAGTVVDGHTHLDHARRDEPVLPVDQALALAESVGVDRVVQIGCDLASAAWSVDLAATDSRVLAGVALHPTEATRIQQREGESGLDAALEQIAALAQHPRVRVIGETGLDHYWVPKDDIAGRAAQERSFRWHIELARSSGSVLQIHDRDAHSDVVRILRDHDPVDRVVFHCFSGGIELAEVCAENGWYASFGGTITFANAEGLRAALRILPLDLLQVETDAPYLAPHPLRGKRNTSALMPLTVRRMASEIGVDEAELCERLTQTAQSLYGDW